MSWPFCSRELSRALRDLVCSSLRDSRQGRDPANQLKACGTVVGAKKDGDSLEGVKAPAPLKHESTSTFRQTALSLLSVSGLSQSLPLFLVACGAYSEETPVVCVGLTYFPLRKGEFQTSPKKERQTQLQEGQKKKGERSRTALIMAVC